MIILRAPVFRGFFFSPEDLVLMKKTLTNHNFNIRITFNFIAYSK